MTRRRRFIETMTFGCPDRPARGDYFAYDGTRRRWEADGLATGTVPTERVVCLPLDTMQNDLAYYCAPAIWEA